MIAKIECVVIIILLIFLTVIFKTKDETVCINGKTYYKTNGAFFVLMNPISNKYLTCDIKKLNIDEK